MKQGTLNSICSKVMIQVTAKMGGIPWSIYIPLKVKILIRIDCFMCDAPELAPLLVVAFCASFLRFYERRDTVCGKNGLIKYRIF